MASAPNRPRQLDIYGNEVEYQWEPEAPRKTRAASPKPQAPSWYVYFVRSVRDWRSLIDPSTGTVYRFLREVPQEKLTNLVSWGRHADAFESEEDAREAARTLVLEGKTFSAGVWNTYYRKQAAPIVVISMTSLEQAQANHAAFLEHEVPNIKADKKGQKKMREQS